MVKSKKFLRVVSALCTASVAATLLCAAPVSAATRLKGDVNNDGVVDITDATTIQRYLVGFNTLDAASQKAADVNFDGTVNITDVTAIQRYLVGYTTGFNALKDTKWTSLSTASTKNIRFEVASPQANVKITVPAAAKRWLTATPVVSSGKVKTIKLTTKTNNTTKARKATVKIVLEGTTYNFAVKQLPKATTPGWDACYTYSMKLDTDPRADVYKPFHYYNNPGTPGRISGLKEYSKFYLDDFTYLLDSSYLSSFKKYTMDRVKADLATMGWGIKARPSAKSTVKEGDWLVCLVYNPSESIRTEKEMVCCFTTAGGPADSTDYHWYRREDNSDGSFTWSHKRGTTAVKTLAKNKTPMDYDSTNNDVLVFSNPIEYNNAMNKYVNNYHKTRKLFDEGKYFVDPEEFDQEFVYYYYPTGIEKSNIEFYKDAYMLVGYFEVGPNAL